MHKKTLKKEKHSQYTSRQQFMSRRKKITRSQSAAAAAARHQLSWLSATAFTLSHYTYYYY